jgi:hypothetical protein
VEIEFDPVKDEANRIKHGIPLSAASGLDLTQAISFADTRHPYGEKRTVAVAPIDGRLHVLVFTLRDLRMRVISLRKANAREKATYDRRG